MSYIPSHPTSPEELETDCIFCGAKAGNWCTARKGTPSAITHAIRYDIWYAKYVTRPALENLRAASALQKPMERQYPKPTGDIHPVDTSLVLVGGMWYKAYVYMYDHVAFATDKAYLFSIDGLEAWIPKALIKQVDEENSLVYVLYRPSLHSIT